MRLYTNESVPVAIAEGLKRRGVEALLSSCDPGQALNQPNQYPKLDANHRSAVSILIPFREA